MWTSGMMSTYPQLESVYPVGNSRVRNERKSYPQVHRLPPAQISPKRVTDAFVAGKLSKDGGVALGVSDLFFSGFTRLEMPPPSPASSGVSAGMVPVLRNRGSECRRDSRMTFLNVLDGVYPHDCI